METKETIINELYYNYLTRTSRFPQYLKRNE